MPQVTDIFKHYSQLQMNEKDLSEPSTISLTVHDEDLMNHS